MSERLSSSGGDATGKEQEPSSPVPISSMPLPPSIDLSASTDLVLSTLNSFIEDSESGKIYFRDGSGNVRRGKPPSATRPQEELDSSSDERWLHKVPKKSKNPKASEKPVSDDKPLDESASISGMSKLEANEIPLSKRPTRKRVVPIRFQLPKEEDEKPKSKRAKEVAFKPKGRMPYRKKPKESGTISDGVTMRTAAERHIRRLAHQERVELRIASLLLQQHSRSESEEESTTNGS